MARVVVGFVSCFAALGSFVGLGCTLPAAWAAAPASGAPSGPELEVLPGPGVTLSVAGRPYAGDVILVPGGAGLNVVDRVGFEQYVQGIGEMPSNWPMAALEAQAVAARTYALWTVLTHPAGPGGGQICATDACQVYYGLSKAEGPDGARWVAAAEATRGQVLQYEGRVIEALYGSSDGGQTLYGGVAWLPSVADPQDSLAPEHQWSWSVPLGQIAGVLGVPAGQTLVSLVSSSSAITETLRGPGSATSTFALTPDRFHGLLNSKMAPPAGLDLPLPSYRYSVSTYGTDVKIAGFGDGDGLGLSQYGALGKAEQGWTAAQILGNYYRGTTDGPLPAGEMPSTISITLWAGVPSATVAANGPVRMVDGSGRLVAATSGPAAWRAGTGGPGVVMDPTSGVPTNPAPVTVGDTAPAPQRIAAPAGSAAAPGTGVTSATDSRRRTPDRSSPVPVPSAGPFPAAGSAAGGLEAVSERGAPGRRTSSASAGGGFWAVLGAGTLIAVAGGGVLTRFHRRSRSKAIECPARR